MFILITEFFFCKLQQRFISMKLVYFLNGVKGRWINGKFIKKNVNMQELRLLLSLKSLPGFLNKFHDENGVSYGF